MSKKTIQECAQAALDVQDACNLSGVVFVFADVMHVINEESTREGHGTTWKNNHPIVRLFVDKMASLSGMQGLTDEVMEHFRAAYERTKELAV
jgi:hypothetical protein